jgi:hypothetical protein
MEKLYHPTAGDEGDWTVVHRVSYDECLKLQQQVCCRVVLTGMRQQQEMGIAGLAASSSNQSRARQQQRQRLHAPREVSLSETKTLVWSKSTMQWYGNLFVWSKSI